MWLANKKQNNAQLYDLVYKEEHKKKFKKQEK